MAAATVEAVLAAVPSARVVGMRGGDKRNAIARECTATVAVSWCCWGSGAGCGQFSLWAVLRVDGECLGDYKAVRGGLAPPACTGTPSCDALPSIQFARQDVLRLLCCPFAVSSRLHALNDHHKTTLVSQPQVPADQLDTASSCVASRFASFQQEYGLKEPGLAITAAPAAAPASACLAPAAGQQLVDLLLTLPHGVIKYSHAVQGGCPQGWPHNAFLCRRVG